MRGRRRKSNAGRYYLVSEATVRWLEKLMHQIASAAESMAVAEHIRAVGEVTMAERGETPKPVKLSQLRRWKKQAAEAEADAEALRETAVTACGKLRANPVPETVDELMELKHGLRKTERVH